MKHLLWVVGLAALIPAYIFFEKFNDNAPGQGRSNLLISVAFLIVSLICLGIFFFRQFRAESSEEISITKFGELRVAAGPGLLWKAQPTRARISIASKRQLTVCYASTKPRTQNSNECPSCVSNSPNSFL